VRRSCDAKKLRGLMVATLVGRKANYDIVVLLWCVWQESSFIRREDFQVKLVQIIL
jgi:hypothetical protein